MRPGQRTAPPYALEALEYDARAEAGRLLRRLGIAASGGSPLDASSHPSDVSNVPSAYDETAFTHAHVTSVYQRQSDDDLHDLDRFLELGASFALPDPNGPRPALLSATDAVIVSRVRLRRAVARDSAPFWPREEGIDAPMAGINDDSNAGDGEAAEPARPRSRRGTTAGIGFGFGIEAADRQPPGEFSGRSLASSQRAGRVPRISDFDSVPPAPPAPPVIAASLMHNWREGSLPDPAAVRARADERRRWRPQWRPARPTAFADRTPAADEESERHPLLEDARARLAARQSAWLARARELGMGGVAAGSGPQDGGGGASAGARDVGDGAARDAGGSGAAGGYPPRAPGGQLRWPLPTLQEPGGSPQGLPWRLSEFLPRTARHPTHECCAGADSAAAARPPAGGTGAGAAAGSSRAYAMRLARSSRLPAGGRLKAPHGVLKAGGAAGSLLTRALARGAAVAVAVAAAQ